MDTFIFVGNIPVDVSVNATLQDVASDISDYYTNPIFSYGGIEYRDLSQSLADLGIGSEARLEVREKLPVLKYEIHEPGTEHHLNRTLGCILDLEDMVVYDIYSSSDSIFITDNSITKDGDRNRYIHKLGEKCSSMFVYDLDDLVILITNEDNNDIISRTEIILVDRINIDGLECRQSFLDILEKK